MLSYYVRFETFGVYVVCGVYDFWISPSQGIYSWKSGWRMVSFGPVDLHPRQYPFSEIITVVRCVLKKPGRPVFFSIKRKNCHFCFMQNTTRALRQKMNCIELKCPRTKCVCIVPPSIAICSLRMKIAANAIKRT